MHTRLVLSLAALAGSCFAIEAVGIADTHVSTANVTSQFRRAAHVGGGPGFDGADCIRPVGGSCRSRSEHSAESFADSVRKPRDRGGEARCIAGDEPMDGKLGDV